MAEKLTKKELKEQRRLERLEQATTPSQNNTMKWVVIGVAGLLFFGLFGFLIFSAKEKNRQEALLPRTFDNVATVRGEASAPNTLTEFADLQCPGCKYYEPFVQKLLEEEKGKLKLVYKHFPLMGHKYAMIASLATEASGKQGKFWEMHDLLFEKQEELSGASNGRDQVIKYAESLDLNMDQFKKDISDKDLEAKINQNRDEGTKNGVNSTPTFFINGRMIQLSGDYNAFKQTIIEGYGK